MSRELDLILLDCSKGETPLTYLLLTFGGLLASDQALLSARNRAVVSLVLDNRVNNAFASMPTTGP